jgi:hypothetical protein
MTIVASEPVPLHFKTIPVRRLGPDGNRDEEFRKLALNPDTTEYSAECTVRALVHPSLLRHGGDAAWQAFRNYRAALRAADGIEADTMDFRDYGPYPCAEQAWLDACQDADGWLRVLLDGDTVQRKPWTPAVKAGA